MHYFILRSCSDVTESLFGWEGGGGNQTFVSGGGLEDGIAMIVFPNQNLNGGGGGGNGINGRHDPHSNAIAFMHIPLSDTNSRCNVCAGVSNIHSLLVIFVAAAVVIINNRTIN